MLEAAACCLVLAACLYYGVYLPMRDGRRRRTYIVLPGERADCGGLDVEAIDSAAPVRPLKGQTAAKVPIPLGVPILGDPCAVDSDRGEHAATV